VAAGREPLAVILNGLACRFVDLPLRAFLSLDLLPLPFCLFSLSFHDRNLWFCQI
jgi:hypothetical protein